MTPLPSPGIHWCEVMTVDWMGNGVLAFLAAVGIAALVWLVTGVLLRRRPPEVPAVLVLPACGGAEALEGWVRTLLEVRTQLGKLPWWTAVSRQRERGGCSCWRNGLIKSWCWTGVSWTGS